jgi:1,4-alpha-glucan branching enzyme
MVRTQSRGADSTVEKKSSMKTKSVPVDYFAPEANTVAVAGDFNGWDMQADMLRKNKAGWWKCNLKLAPGRYQYRFVVNGEQWSEDPENPNKEPNEFASFNSILEVR